MAKKFPIDEFDSATEQGGRHRARRTAKDRLVEWLRIFVAAGLVAVIGYGGLKLIEASNVFDGYLPGSTASATPSATAGPGVAVLDGGGRELAAQAGQILKDAGFNVTGASTLVDTSKKPITIDTTVVVITDEILRTEAEAVAEKVTTKLGTPAVIVSPEFEGPITVVLGKDYKITDK